MLDIITAMTLGKWWLSFDVAAQNHSAAWTAFSPGEQIVGEEEYEGGHQVVLGAERR